MVSIVRNQSIQVWVPTLVLSSKKSKLKSKDKRGISKTVNDNFRIKMSKLQIYLNIIPLKLNLQFNYVYPELATLLTNNMKLNSKC